MKSEVAELLDACNYFLPNREELAGLTGEEDVLVGLQKVPAGLRAVIKLWKGGAAYLWRSDIFNVTPPEVSVVDTVGGGDAFNAAFVHGLGLGATLEKAAKAAARAASTAISSVPRFPRSRKCSRHRRLRWYPLSHLFTVGFTKFS